MKVEMEKSIQARVFQQRSRLDEEIDVLWHLMQRCRGIMTVRFKQSFG
jgi:hypothetical protein